MTVKECYDIIGDYNDAMARLLKEDLAARFLKKFEADKSYDICLLHMRQVILREFFLLPIL